MDYLESTYDTTRREVKEKMHDYFVSWNKNYGNEGGMSYEIVQHEDISDSDIAIWNPSSRPAMASLRTSRRQ